MLIMDVVLAALLLFTIYWIFKFSIAVGQIVNSKLNSEIKKGEQNVEKKKKL